MADELQDFLDATKNQLEVFRNANDLAMADLMKHGATVLNENAAAIVQDITQTQSFPT